MIIIAFKYTFEVIHSFDPGIRTGYIRYNRSKSEIEEHKILKDYYDIGEQLQSIDKYYEMVIFEKSVGKLTTGDQFTMCKYVGFIEGFCEFYGIHNVGQIPGKRKGFINISKQYFKDHIKNYEVHNIDAFAHILSYIHNKEGIEKFKKKEV